MREMKLKKKPFFRNPSEIPDYDRIDVVADADIHADTLGDDSMVSCDDFVPDIAHGADTCPTEPICLN